MRESDYRTMSVAGGDLNATSLASQSHLDTIVERLVTETQRVHDLAGCAEHLHARLYGASPEGKDVAAPPQAPGVYGNLCYQVEALRVAVDRATSAVQSLQGIA